MTGTSKDFAVALFSLAAQTGEEQAFDEALTSVADRFAAEDGYAELLSSPGIPKSERIALIGQVLEGQVPETVVSFVQLLCEKGKITSLSECAKEYRVLYRDALKRSTAKITSAVELTEDEKDRLRAALEQRTGRKVLLECSVDHTLLGGIVVEMDGKVLDGSLKHRLREVKEVIGK